MMVIMMVMVMVVVIMVLLDHVDIELRLTSLLV